MLGEIVAEDSSEKCLLESRKVESKIEKRKVLGIKATIPTTQSKLITEVEANLEPRAKAGADLPVVLETVSTVVSLTIKEISQLLTRSAKSVEKITTLKQFAKVVVQTRETTVNRGQGKEREKYFMK